MEEQTKVLVNLEEYKNFIISQYEQGKYKQTLTQQIKDLEAQKAEVEAQLPTIKEKALQLLFKHFRMKYDSKKEMIDAHGNYFGYDTEAVGFLQYLGLSINDMIDYINKQWDLKEAAEKAIDPEEA